MTPPSSQSQTYRRPPLDRGCDPQRMNWLWQLVCEVAALQPGEVVDSLRATGVPVEPSRVRSWLVPPTDEGYFPMSIAEVERNLRALIAVRRAGPSAGPADALPGSPNGD